MDRVIDNLALAIGRTSDAEETLLPVLRSAKNLRQELTNLIDKE